MTTYIETVEELIAAIEAANAAGSGVIELKPDTTFTITDSNKATEHSNVGLPEIRSELTIRGNGSIIERDLSASQFCFLVTFEGESPRLKLENITFRNGGGATYSPLGGAINFYSDNDEETQQTLELLNCSFENNQSLNIAGAIYCYAGLIAEGCTFKNNKSREGAAIYTEWADVPDQTIRLINSTFENNENTNASTITIWQGYGDIIIDGCTFKNNVAKRAVSCISVFGELYGPDNEYQKLVITNTNFIDNEALDDYVGLAPKGIIGVMYADDADVYIYNCLFDGNTAVNEYPTFTCYGYHTFVANYNTFINNEATSDPSAPIFDVDGYDNIDVSHNEWGSGQSLPSGLTYEPAIGVTAPTENEGEVACPCSYEGNDAPVSNNPISLRLAEKRWDATDIQLNTPMGALAFTRQYRQSQQDSLDFMGLGWTHNHRYFLEEDGGSPNKITVHLAGSKVIFYDDDADDVFEGAAGSVSTIVKSSGEYDLTASDESVYHFDSNKRLTTRTLNNGELWTYSYDGSGNLTEVSDGYGRSLKFVYYSGLGGADAFKNGQLWRVGTHTSTNLDSSPQTPYIQLDYTDDGTGEALLTDVQDVRGEEWTYRYYGSDISETDTKWTNFLVERISPSVDSDGDGSADGTIMLEELSYSGTARDEITGIVQKRGDELLSKTMSFDSVNEETTETIEGLVVTHTFGNGVYRGTKDADNNEQTKTPLSNYRPAYQEDANGNRNMMKWSADGKRLEGVLDAGYNETAFSYDSLDRLIASTDAEGRVTNYIYEGNRRQPSQILIAADAAEDLVINGDMEDDSDWSDVGTPTTSQQSQTEVSDGEYSWYVDAASGEGVESSTQISFSDEKTYLITARVYADSGTVKMGVAGHNDWDVSSSENDEWETLRAIHTATSSFSADLQFLADGGAAEFYVDSVHVVELTGLERWQQFVYDDKGRTLEEYLLDQTDATALQSTVREYGTSGNGNGLLTAITVKDLLDSSNDSTTQYDYDEQGRVIRTHKISMFGTCEYNHTVYDEAGNVLGTACGPVTDSPIPSSIGDLEDLYDVNDVDKKHTRITSHEYDEMGRRVATTGNYDTTFARTNRTIYDALGRVTRTIQNYVVQGSSAPGDWVWSDSNERWEYADNDSTAVSHGSELDENIISETNYNGRGLVYRRRDVLGRVTLYGYNDADRLIKTVQNAATPGYDASYATGDPDLSAYSASSNADEDIITETVYDPNGNVVKSIDARGSVTFTVYDALSRPVKVISNAAHASYDILTDLSLTNYGDYSTDPDKDMVSITEYDAMGRVIRSQRLLENRGAEAEWDTMLYGYDVLGRQVASIQHAATSDYDIAADSDLSAYPLSMDTDVDMLTQTVYDNQGRVKETIDVNNRVTRMIYDGMNRQVMTIANYVAQATEPENWEWVSTQWEDGSSTAINHGTGYDQNIISQTIYDSDGRVESTRNVQGLISRNAYDSAGRSYLSVQNYVEQGMSDPVDWEWVSTQWEDGSSSAIARGTNYDQNLISQPDYDDEHRVYQTRDARGNLNRQVYDEAGRVKLSIANYVAQTDGSSNPVPPETWYYDNDWKGIADVSAAVVSIDHGTENDQNRISETQYDLLGRGYRTRDAAGRETYTVYDAVGRVIRRVQNYVEQGNPVVLPDEWEWDATDKRYEEGSGNAIDHGTDKDQNIISETVYNQAGQVVTTRDAFGTQTAFSYDAAGRRLQVTQASNTGLATSSYTCYDKAGRVLRSIANYIPHYDEDQNLISADAWDANENWIFHPEAYVAREVNIISQMRYDRAGRRVESINPVGDISTTTYFKDGQVDSITDPEGMVTVYRYDALRRRTLVVQSYVDNGEDPALWLYDDVTDNRYEESDGTAIVHGTDNDQNIIVMVAYDIAGRMVSMRDPRGNLTTYSYDKLGRRTSLTNPLSKVWSTAYNEISGAQQTTMTYPGVNAGSSYDVVRDFDRFGRLLQIDYNDSSNTPEVSFGYDIQGNRLNMTENNGTSDVRITDYGYDKLNRLTQVDFDSDADSTVDETVEYEYDIRGLRTKLTMPGSLSISYSYDDKGRLISLTDWDSQTSEFAYDALNRHVATLRPNGMRSSYKLDGAGRLRELRHENKKREILAAFRYAVDGRGSRTQAQELLLEPSASLTTATIQHDDAELAYTGNWTDTAGFHETTQWDARMALLFVGDEDVELVIGEGPDHGIFDLYIDGTLYESVDAYAASADSHTIDIPVRGDGFHTLEIRNRRVKNPQSSGYKVRFQSLSSDSALTWNVIDYSYDNLSRLIEADYNSGANIYNYGYDVTGNLVDYDGVTRTYNAANQMTNDGTNTLTYDNNGNLRTVGSDTYTWDRANRLLSVGNHSYVYDGLGNRVQQTVSSVVTDYLNDLQPGLTKLLKQDDGTNVEHFVHAPRGIHAVDVNYGTDWNFYAQDGLGSVRSIVDDSAVVQSSMSFDPYGNPMASYGAGVGYFGFTGEQTDANGSVFLRARYYEPSKGTFIKRDPAETPNRYAYVSGNPVNRVDPTGLFDWNTLTIEQDDTLSCIAAEAEIPVEEFHPFFYMVQALNNAPYLGQSILTNPPGRQSFCSTVSGPYQTSYNPVSITLNIPIPDEICGVHLINISPQPVVYTDRICLGQQILIPNEFGSCQNIIATGKSNEHRYCCGGLSGNDCNRGEAERTYQTPNDGKIFVTGLYAGGEATTSYLPSLFTDLVYDGLAVGFEWYRETFGSRQGWLATASFNIDVFSVGSIEGNGGGKIGTWDSWPNAGDYLTSISYNFGLGLATMSYSPNDPTANPFMSLINGEFVMQFGLSGGISTLSGFEDIVLPSLGSGATASLYLGDGPFDLSVLRGLVEQEDNMQKLQYMIEVVSNARP